MPRGDGTGPQGYGPMTGRARGYCAGFDTPGYMNYGPGRAFGRGFRRGYRGRYLATGIPGRAYAPGYYEEGIAPERYDDQSERRLLKNRARYLEDELNYIKKRLEELDED